MDFEPPPSSTPGYPEQDPLGPEMVLEGTEPAWERKAELGFFTAYKETVKQVLLNPTETFDRLYVGGGFVNPLIFAVIGGTAVTFAGAFYGTILNAILAMAGATDTSSGMDPNMQMMINIATGWGSAIFAPIWLAIFCFVLAGVYHVSMMMLGGARGDFETTFRVVTYSLGASVIIGFVPGCGGLIGSVWGVVCTIIGLSRAHQVETWKGVVAWLITLVICCVMIVILYAGLVAGIFGLIRASGSFP